MLPCRAALTEPLSTAAPNSGWGSPGNTVGIATWTLTGYTGPAGLSSTFTDASALGSIDENNEGVVVSPRSSTVSTPYTFTLDYMVTVTGPWKLSSAEVTASLNTLPAGAGYSVVEQVYSSSLKNAGSLLQVPNPNPPPPGLNPFTAGTSSSGGYVGGEFLNGGSYQTLYVTETVKLYGGASLKGWDNSFNVVPEPSSVVACALMVLPFGASALRILRRKVA
jgi:hypothetical protein